MKELDNEVQIDATAEQVWQLLTDFASFPEWNPFMQRVTGESRIGTQLQVTLQPSGAQAQTFRLTVLRAEPNRESRWRGQLLFPGLLDVEHIFTIEPLGASRVRFRQCEVFTGLFAPLRRASSNTDVRRGLREMNQALKLRAEHSQARS